MGSEMCIRDSGYEAPRPGDEDHHTEAPEEAAMDTLARVEAENKKSKKK